MAAILPANATAAELQIPSFRGRTIALDSAGTSGTGFIWTAFRASDDAAALPYNIPEQMFASVALRDLAVLANEGYKDRDLATRANLMSQELREAIGRLGVIYDFRAGWIYAYEVDGNGAALPMDDANLPSCSPARTSNSSRAIPRFICAPARSFCRRTTRRSLAVSTPTESAVRIRRRAGFGRSR